MRQQTKAEPNRQGFLKHDYWWPCERCALVYPFKWLKRERITNMLVCPEDYDKPTVMDRQSRAIEQHALRRMDRIGMRTRIDSSWPEDSEP